MSTSILYHAFGIRDVKYLGTRYQWGEIIFDAEMTKKLAICPECQSRAVNYRGSKIRPLRLVPIGSKVCWLYLSVHRLHCRDCGAVRWPHLPFTGPRLSYTLAVQRLIFDLLKYMTIAAVAGYLWVGWDLVKDAHKGALSRRYRHIRVKDLEYIGIDEFSVRKGFVYMTIVVDLREGRILHVAWGKGGESIAGFLKTLARRAPKLKAVALDMNDGYIWAVKKYLPRVAIVLDHYHIIALVNRAIDELRRQHQAELGAAGKKTIKGARFLLLHNYENLPSEKKRRLEKLLTYNQPLFTMYTMKEQLRLLWNMPSRKKAAAFLAEWCRDAMNSGILQLIRVGKSLAAYRNLILNFITHPISTGQVEGINNKIKTLKRQAYGYRDIEYFKLRLFHLHQQKYSLTG